MEQYENVILITIDSLRWDAFFNKDGTPKKELSFLNTILVNSIIFKNAFANGAGTPACFPSIMTSTYPLMYGGYKAINKNRKLVSEVLQEEGIRTIGIPNNAYLSKYFGYSRGFDFFYDPIGSVDVGMKQRIMYYLSKVVHRNQLLLDISQGANIFINIHPPYLEADEINNYVKSLIDNQKLKSPFFLWLHLMDAHIPYYSSKINYNKENISKFIIRKLHFKTFMYEHVKWLFSEKDLLMIKKLYDLKVIFLDQQLAELFKLLESYKLLKDTLVIIAADHGEEFLEHGDLIHPPKLYDELIHVPLIMFAKDIGGPIYVDNLAEHLDIAPTIAEALKVKVPKQYLGVSLFEIAEDKRKKDYVISEVAQPKYKLEMDYSKRKTSVRTKKVKFIYNADTSNEFYNLKVDSHEKQNIIDSIDKEVFELFKKITMYHIAREEKTLGNLFIKLKEKFYSIESSF